MADLYDANTPNVTFQIMAMMVEGYWSKALQCR